MGMYDGISGLVELRLVTADMESSFDAIIQEGIGLYCVQVVDELTAHFVIKRSELSAIQQLMRKRGEELALCGTRGIYWTLRRLMRRPVLIAGALMMIFLTVFLPTRILFLRVDGNNAVASRRIIEAAENCGIGFGARREAVRSEKVKNRLLALLPDLEWAGVNTRGCVAFISVRERTHKEIADPTGPGSIVAARDGIISSITVSHGTAMCTVGEAVLEGQLLISGYTDCGIALLSGTAQGEIYAYTSRYISAVSPLSCQYKGNIQRTERRYSVIIGKNRINLWKGSGICPATCDRMYDRYDITLPGGFSLPVCIVTETIHYYEPTPGRTPGEGVFLEEAAERYLLGQMAAGKILRQNTELTACDDLWYLNGSYGCLEMIGRSKREEIGEAVWQK